MILLVLFSFAISLSAQEKITNQTVVEMVKMGFSPDVINAKIMSETTEFDVSMQALKALKDQGVPQEVLEAMIKNSNFYADTAQNVARAIAYPVQVREGKIFVKNTELKKGGNLKVFLPANRGNDFITIEEKKGLLNVKNISTIASAVGLGAAAVGLGSNDLGTLIGAIDVSNKATAVVWGAEALEKINELPISKQAKKIAGKTFEITDIKVESPEEIIATGKIDKKNYTIRLQEAFVLGEVQLP